jgi:NADH-quinone oxidoreductase subunit E
MSLMPGLGIVKGMVLTLLRMVQRKVTVQYPEVVQEISPRHRGRLILLYDEYGTLKCETCFQCAQACPIEIIDMGGVDTRDRYHVHWGPAEQYGERREESALRRSGRTVPDDPSLPFLPLDLGALEAILAEEEYDPKRLVTILERTQEAYGNLPVAALQHISHQTGAWYSEIYGVASGYDHLRFEPASGHVIGVCRCSHCAVRGSGRIQEALEEALGTPIDGVSPDGSVRLVSVDCQGESEAGPLVTLDGVPQADLDADGARRLAEQLRAAAGKEARV